MSAFEGGDLAKQGEAASTHQRLGLVLIALLLMGATLAASLTAKHLREQREYRWMSHEVELLGLQFEAELNSLAAVVAGFADAQALAPHAAGLTTLGRHTLERNPALLALGWFAVGDDNHPRVISLSAEAEQSLSAVWQSASWRERVELRSAEKYSAVSQPITVQIQGSPQPVVLYFASSTAGLGSTNNSNGSRVFGVLQLSQVVHQVLDPAAEFIAQSELQYLSEHGEAQSLLGTRHKIDKLTSVDDHVHAIVWGGREFVLQLQPSARQLSAVERMLPWLVAVLGLAISAFAVRCLFLLQHRSRQRSRELALREQEIETRQLESEVILDVAQVSILVLDKEGRVVGRSRRPLNPEVELTTGEMFESMVDDGVLKYMDGTPVLVRDNPILKALRGERLSNVQMYRSGDDGTSYHTFNACPIINADEEIVGAVSVASDITDLVISIQEQKLANAQLASSNLRLQQFASVASHDLQEPLRKITSFASLLEHQLGQNLEGESRQYLDFMVDGAQRMTALVQDILAYSEITPGTEELNDVDLAEVLASVQQEYADLLQQHSGNLSLVTASLPLYTSTRMLPRLLGNLISNAIKYRHPERAPQIEIAAEQQLDGVMLSVADNGMGIAAEQREQVFQMFKRLHRGDNIKGTGIGLSICQQIVELSGGSIWIEDGLQGGSKFCLFFPAQRLSMAS